MTTERDPQTRFVLSWLREDTHENAERVLLRALDEVDTTPQRRSWWAAWRTFHMSKLAMTAMATALLAVAVVGYNLLPTLRILGPGATPSPSPTLLARGTFVAGYTIAIDAVAQGAEVTGRMTATEAASGSAFSVDLNCTRTTADGSILIGGITELGNGLAPEGSYAGIVLTRGTPVGARVWSQLGGPGSMATSCLAFLVEQWAARARVSTSPIVGSVELASPGAVPLLSPTLYVRGSFVTARRGTVRVLAFSEGTSVTGHMIVEGQEVRGDPPGWFDVDLQCARTTVDGFVMIGGYTTAATGGWEGVSPVGTLAAIVLKRGSPVQATVWSMRGGGTGATSCLGYLDERFNEKLMDGVVDDDDPGPIQIYGSIDIGPAQ